MKGERQMRHCTSTLTFTSVPLPYICRLADHTISGGDFGGIDFSKLGGGAGMPTGDEDDDESDDEMPPLEGEEEPEKAAKADDGKEAVASS